MCFLSCLNIRYVALETEQRICLTRAVSLLYKKINCLHCGPPWCSDHTNKIQESPTHPRLGSLEMFKCVLFKHIRDQFC